MNLSTESLVLHPGFLLTTMKVRKHRVFQSRGSAAMDAAEAHGKRHHI